MDPLLINQRGVEINIVNSHLNVFQAKDPLVDRATNQGSLYLLHMSNIEFHTKLALHVGLAKSAMYK